MEETSMELGQLVDEAKLADIPVLVYGKAVRAWSQHYQESVDTWFDAAVSPLLRTVKEASVRRNILQRRRYWHLLRSSCTAIGASTTRSP